MNACLFWIQKKIWLNINAEQQSANPNGHMDTGVSAWPKISFS